MIKRLAIKNMDFAVILELTAGQSKKMLNFNDFVLFLFSKFCIIAAITSGAFQVIPDTFAAALNVLR